MRSVVTQCLRVNFDATDDLNGPARVRAELQTQGHKKNALTGALQRAPHSAATPPEPQSQNSAPAVWSSGRTMENTSISASISMPTP